MKPELQHAFETLGVPVGTSPAGIQTAYRQLIRTHHPDHAVGDVDAATERLAEINAAKDLIDRSPVAEPIRVTKRPTSETNAQTAADLRARREADARAFRKAMEAKATANAPAETFHHADHTGARTCAQTAQDAARQEADEEARRRRQAVFEAMMSGKAPLAKSSLLGRLRTLAQR